MAEAPGSHKRTGRDWPIGPWGFSLGPLHVEVGGMAYQIGRVWVPDGLHLWFRERSIHAYWKHSPYQPRLYFDQDGNGA